MGPGQIPRGILLSRQLLRVYDSVQNSAARATAAAQHLNLQLAHHSAAASNNLLESKSAYDHSNLLCLPPITSSFSPPSTESLPANLAPAISSPYSTRRFSSQATPGTKQTINEKHHYEKRVKDVRKKYIEEMAEKRRREQAFEQKKKGILAAREQQRREARLAAVREGAEEKERLLEERRKEKELRRLAGWERQKEIKAEIQAERDAKNAIIIASSKSWVKEEELESRIELALDNPYAL